MRFPPPQENNLRAFESGYDYGSRAGTLEESLEEIAEAVEE